MTSHPTWSQIKAQLTHLDKSDLLNVLKDLYQLNNDNKVFLASRITPQQSIPSEPYKLAIQREFNPQRGVPRLNLQSARRSLTNFKKACADPIAVIDMLIFYVEQGVACTNRYGDIDEPFYNSHESAFSEALELIRKIGNAEIAEKFQPRLRKIVSATNGMGWGFHDYLSEVYSEVYPM